MRQCRIAALSMLILCASMRLASGLLAVRGRIEREGDLVHLVAHRLEDWSEKLLLLSQGPEMLEVPAANADELRRGTADAAEGDPQHPRTRAARLPKHLPARHPRNVRDLIPKSRDFH